MNNDLKKLIILAQTLIAHELSGVSTHIMEDVFDKNGIVLMSTPRYFFLLDLKDDLYNLSKNIDLFTNKKSKRDVYVDLNSFIEYYRFSTFNSKIIQEGLESLQPFLVDTSFFGRVKSFYKYFTKG